MGMEYKESDLSLVIPSRKNLKYLKWGYEAIRKVSKDVWICYADDASDDDTWQWMTNRIKMDPRVKILQNKGPLRDGHTILYDRIVNELVETKLACVYHADMFCFENTFKNALKHMAPRTIVSMTRVEPPLHPEGPEKLLFDMGVEPEEFKEEEVTQFVKESEEKYKDQVTEGIFAPWIFVVDDFKKIGGHDEGFYPQSKEDSDIFNRFQLDGVKLIQSRDSFVAHLTCRGSRRNPNLTSVTQDSPEWLEHNQRSTRNFIRKWGHFCKHDQLMKPIIPHKYDIALIMECKGVDPKVTAQLIHALEPWCNRLAMNVSDETAGLLSAYIDHENVNTKFELRERVVLGYDLPNDIVLKFNASEFLQDQNANFQFIQNLPDILTDSAEVGDMEYECFKISISKLTHYEKDLIVCENTGWRRKNHK
jgi:hypothetical protein